MTVELKPEDLVRRVQDELADHNTFDGNFDDVSEEMLLRFLKCDQSGIRHMCHEMNFDEFAPAYAIAHFEIVTSLERIIAKKNFWVAQVFDMTNGIKQQWLDALESSDKSGELRPAWVFSEIEAFLKSIKGKE